MMDLSAPMLSSWERCRRRYALERDYRVLRHPPRRLFSALWAEAARALSQRELSAPQAAERAATEFLEAAARPGLDTTHDPFCLARDYCAIFETSLEALARTPPPPLAPPRRAPGWTFSSYADPAGALHRFVAVERWDADERARQLHGWKTFGDACAARQPVTLHVIETGRASRGHLGSDWCRAWRHVAIAHLFRFRKRDGSPLDPTWKPVWFQDERRNQARAWVDLMETDGVNVIHQLAARAPAPEYVEMFERDLEARRAEIAAARALDWRSLPMHRSACDLPLCPWQPVCYGPPGATPETAGGFAKGGTLQP